MPSHVLHGVSTIWPLPWQRSHVLVDCTTPNGVRWLMRTWPEPPQFGQVLGLVPLAAPGDVFKLKGKGIQSINGRGRGDQYVRVTVEVPKNLSKRQKELLQEFEQNADEKNYQKRKSFFGKIKDLFED